MYVVPDTVYNPFSFYVFLFVLNDNMFFCVCQPFVISRSRLKRPVSVRNSALDILGDILQSIRYSAIAWDS